MDTVPADDWADRAFMEAPSSFRAPATLGASALS